jgi:hypothetical protein
MAVLGSRGVLIVASITSGLFLIGLFALHCCFKHIRGSVADHVRSEISEESI